MGDERCMNCYVVMYSCLVCVYVRACVCAICGMCVCLSVHVSVLSHLVVRGCCGTLGSVTYICEN